MVCPYCLGRFNISHSIDGSAERIDWGLLQCRCFEFPIVDGVLLLSLAKGYGGSEEVLAPFVPLQVAAIRYIRKGDLSGLQGWIRRQIPLLHRLMASPSVDYVSFSKELNSRLWPQVEKDLFAWSRYEVLGRRGAMKERGGLVNTLASNPVGYALMKVRRRLFPHVWSTFYMMRFISEELAELRARLQDISIDGPVLSLCCGHGPFELLLNGRTPQVPVVSMDGQVINLFVVKRFIAPDSDYICHDAQFSLPFEDGHFRHVFSSSCLSEIPTQAHFVREARRVTSESGWTIFDGVTPQEDTRIVPTRFYRVCQNHFANHEGYFDLMLDCSAGRAVYVTPSKPAKPSWSNNTVGLDRAPTATFMFTGDVSCRFIATRTSEFSSKERELLAVNPRYEVRAEGSTLRARLRTRGTIWKRKVPGDGAMPSEILIERSRVEDAEYLSRLYQSGAIVLLPKNFGSNVVRLFAR
jgi:Methyltransferase domain